MGRDGEVDLAGDVDGELFSRPGWRPIAYRLIGVAGETLTLEWTQFWCTPYLNIFKLLDEETSVSGSVNRFFKIINSLITE
jgi:hypothetical protein